MLFRSGHVGLPLSLQIAHRGHDVVAIDSNLQRVDMIKNGLIPFLEPGLKSLLSSVLVDGSFKIDHRYEMVDGAEVVIVVVGTDLNVMGQPQNSSVFAAIRQFEKYLSPATSLVLRSTVMPNTTELVSQSLEGRVGEVAFCPERIAEGNALRELEDIPQLVGTREGKGSEKLTELFSSLGIAIVNVTWVEAELGKLMLNA